MRQLGRLLHHDFPKLLGGSAAYESKFEDACSTRAGASASATARPRDRLPNFGSIDTSSFSNPVLTAADVTDYGRVDYVADPFFLLGPDEWHVYFETFNPARDPTAVISRATSRDRGRTWSYDGIVLNAGVHASFPFVFRWEDDIWMVPNLDPDDEISPIFLYRSDDGGKTFRRHTRILNPEMTGSDRVVFQWRDRWWLFVSLAGERRELRVYHSDELTARDWAPHELNPVAVDVPRVPGGRPLVTSDRIVAFFQNGPGFSGDVVEAYEITELSPTAYNDKRFCPEPIAEASDELLGWNSGMMHTFDPRFTGDRWVCAVDGNIGFGKSVFTPHWSIGIYSIPARSRQ